MSVLVAVAAIAIIGWCNRLPPLGNRTSSTAITDTANTRLGRGVASLIAARSGVSGVHPLRDARDAFAARHLLAGAAERSLDVQYYIWRNDLSGTLLMKALVDAADRGVRVRLLLDDNNTTGLDAVLAAVDSHPGIEVRLFNPFAIRKFRPLAYLTDFARLNRRMHNKSFTADNQVTVIGGRNVGDEYFGATEDVLFADLDVMAIGPVVRDVSSDFDRYWASESSYPADRLLPPAAASETRKIAERASNVTRHAGAVAYMSALRQSSFVREVLAGTLPFEWAVTRMISDPPSKALDRADEKELLFQKFGEIFGSPSTTIDLVSPYFVPGSYGVDLFGGWSRRGVRVRVLTNSLEATDVAAVHAGYAKRRKPLLQAGVRLYELRLMPGERPTGSSGQFGSSGSSLHAKTFAVDGSRIFIGSFNFDPRSAELNTEMGFVIDSPVLARRMSEVFDKDVPQNAYGVQLANSNELYWTEQRGGQVIRHRTEPGTGFWQRLGVTLLSMLPIEPLL
ncbi:MAG TPA: phospholipase D family protein [Thermoanaerobaculia bacterium]